MFPSQCRFQVVVRARLHNKSPERDRFHLLDHNRGRFHAWAAYQDRFHVLAPELDRLLLSLIDCIVVPLGVIDFLFWLQTFSKRLARNGFLICS